MPQEPGSESKAALDTAAVNATWPPDLDTDPSSVQAIGHYRLLEQVGAGGMGVVYKAEQLRPVKRIVALKLIKLGMDTPQVVARFQSERQALAMLEHPGIARVYDAGATETGRPYFVMEYVPGRPITEYCDAHRLPTAQRLELFQRVCHAVQHAHFKGILHRDLKPSNILIVEIDGHPQPKVIDFGVAKATQQDAAASISMMTHAGQLVGTPLYMSPEQAAGADVDTRADVYSLGVVLYELLSGALPFDQHSFRSAGSAQIVRQILDTDPPRPSTRITSPQLRRMDEPALRRQLRGDLDRIVMKAMHKDRAMRYETAAALAEDVRRHLAHEPIAARPPTLAYQARKFARRNRVLVAATTMVVLAAVIGGAAATFGLIRARQALVSAQASQRAAREVNEFLASMLRSVNPERAQGEKVLVRDVLDQASVDLQTQFASQPVVAASLHAIVGSTYHALGMFEPARLHWQTARELRREALGPEHPETLDCENGLASALSALGRRAEAEAILRALIPRRQRLDGPEADLTLTTEEALGLLLAATERGTEAEPLLRHVLDVRRRTLGPDHPDTLTAMHNMSSIAEELGRNDEAVELNRAVVAGRERVLGPNHPSTILSLNNLATTLSKQKRPAEAEPVLRMALQRSEHVLGPDHVRTLACLNNLASTYRLLGQLDAAETMNRELIERLERVLPENHPNMLATLGNLAMVLEAQQKIDEALEIYADLYDRSRRAELPPVQQVWYVTPYGLRLAKYGRFEKSEAPLLEAVRVLEAAGKTRTRRSIDVRDALVKTCEQIGKPDEAARWRAEADALRAEEAASTGPSTRSGP